MNIKKLNYFSAIFFLSIFFYACNKPDGSTIADITITALRPSHGAFNTIDTILGRGFDQIAVLDSVLLNGKKVTFISRSPEQVIVQIPDMAGTGNIDIWYGGKVIHGPVFTYDSTLWVTTLAGNTDFGAVDGQGPDARFNHPNGIAVDQSGNIYVADENNSSIRKITATGTVSTLAGPPAPENGHVDGTGSAARFSSPFGLAIDADGFLYVGDQNNYCIRKVSLSGAVTTLAGIIWNTGPPGGEVDGDASVATFDTPAGVAVDSHGNVFVADLYNNKIRKVTPAGTVTTFAGGDYYHYGQTDGPLGTNLLYSPYQVAINTSGTVYVSDDENHLLRKITPDGIVTTLLGPLEPSITGSDDLFSTTALAVDKAGNLFFSIPVGIIKMTPDGEIIRYAVGGIGEVDGPAQIATYRFIRGIAVDNSGSLYITANNKIRKIAWR